MAVPVLAVSDVRKVYQMGEVQVEALLGLADGRIVSDRRNERRLAPEELRW